MKGCRFFQEIREGNPDESILMVPYMFPGDLVKKKDETKNKGARAYLPLWSPDLYSIV